MRQTPSRFRFAIRILLVWSLLTGVLLALVEGLASLGLALTDTFRADSTRGVGQYDVELGWVGKPNLDNPDMYGPGRDVRLNSRGFRQESEVTGVVPPGKARFICTGDSFTFGEGVANGQDWCTILSAIDSRIEPINMSQPGYGIDQAYLWYMRDGVTLDHSVHLFAFIGDDIRRIQSRAYYRYGKPIIRVGDDGLRTENVPVPRFRPWLSGSIRSFAKKLRLFDLLGRAVDRSPQGEGGPVPKGIGEVAAGILSSLKRWHENQSTLLVVIYLPGEVEYFRDSEWHAWAQTEAKRQGLLFVDLLPEIRKLTEDQVSSYFLQRGPAAGHYSPTGNRWAAETIYDQLQDIPEIRLLLDSLARESAAAARP